MGTKSENLAEFVMKTNCYNTLFFDNFANEHIASAIVGTDVTDPKALLYKEATQTLRHTLKTELMGYPDDVIFLAIVGLCKGILAARTEMVAEHTLHNLKRAL
jgi:hypothetical protein